MLLAGKQTYVDWKFHYYQYGFQAWHFMLGGAECGQRNGRVGGTEIVAPDIRKYIQCLIMEALYTNFKLSKINLQSRRIIHCIIEQVK